MTFQKCFRAIFPDTENAFPPGGYPQGTVGGFGDVGDFGVLESGNAGDDVVHIAVNCIVRSDP